MNLNSGIGINQSNFETEQVDPGRIKILYYIALVMLIVLVGQLLRKQVFEYSTYAAMAQDQQVAEITSEPDRGSIYAYDRTASDFGVSQSTNDSQLHPIAINVTKYDIMVVPTNVEDKEATAKALSEKLEDVNYDELLTDLKTDKLYIPPIAKRVEKEKAEEISNLNLAGVVTVPKSVRYYPEGGMLAQVLGFVNFDGEGSGGVEKYYDSELEGVAGVVYGVKDTHGRVIEVNDQAEAQDGVSLILTIDSTVQFVVEKELKSAIEKYGAQGGSIVIMEPDTGKILAMASEPSYDPNTFNEVSEEDQWKFVNPSVTYSWEPGSIMKPVVMAAAINDGKVEPDTKPDDLEGGFSNMITVDGYEIHNSDDVAHGYETMTEVLENSDNIGMAWVSDKLGKDTMYKYLQSFGFGEKTGIDLEAESSGQLLDVSDWRDVHRVTMSFGQGLSVTPIQMVTAYSVLANGGKLVKPHLLDTVISASGEEREVQITEVREVISNETADKIKEMLISVVENGHGKAAQVEGFRVAGKTGTAQVVNDEGEYEENAHVGGFIGFAPADDPKFVMLVKLDRPSNVEFAESSAAPTFGTIAKWLLTNYYR